MSGWTVYWITRLDTIVALSVFFFVLLSVILIVAIIISYIDPDIWDYIKYRRRTSLSFLLVWFLFAITSFLLPCTKEAVAIYMLPRIANNEKVADIPDKMLNLFNAYLKEWTEGLQDGGKEK